MIQRVSRFLISMDSLKWQTFIWLGSIPILFVLGSAIMGRLNPEKQAEWAKATFRIMCETGSGVIGVPLMYLSAVIVNIVGPVIALMWVSRVLANLMAREKDLIAREKDNS